MIFCIIFTCSYDVMFGFADYDGVFEPVDLIFYKKSLFWVCVSYTLILLNLCFKIRVCKVPLNHLVTAPLLKKSQQEKCLRRHIMHGLLSVWDYSMAVPLDSIKVKLCGLKSWGLFVA